MSSMLLPSHPLTDLPILCDIPVMSLMSGGWKEAQLAIGSRGFYHACTEAKEQAVELSLQVEVLISCTVLN